MDGIVWQGPDQEQGSQNPGGQNPDSQNPDRPDPDRPLPAAADPRKILHIDMDAFYASVEQRDDPRLRGRPVVVGGPGPRGVVAAASYEARAFGIHSAMPSVTARRRCPDLIFAPARFDVYRAVSNKIRAIFADYTDLVEPLSLDEAYLDVSHHLDGPATRIAQDIRARIRAETGLTASAGVSYNKFLATVASGQRKPDGIFVIPPRAGPAFIAALPVRKFHGIGPATAARLSRLGIETGADLRAADPAFLAREFGKTGAWFHAIARGIDLREVRPDRERKSIGAEDTFAADIFTAPAAREGLAPLITKVWRHCEAQGLLARTVTLKVKYADFRQITRSHSPRQPVTGAAAVTGIVEALLLPLFPSGQGVRLLGVTLSNLRTGAGPGAGPVQLSLPI